MFSLQSSIYSSNILFQKIKIELEGHLHEDHILRTFFAKALLYEGHFIKEENSETFYHKSKKTRTFCKRPFPKDIWDCIPSGRGKTRMWV
jgi:hypothetical protein